MRLIFIILCLAIISPVIADDYQLNIEPSGDSQLTISGFGDAQLAKYGWISSSSNNLGGGSSSTAPLTPSLMVIEEYDNRTGKSHNITVNKSVPNDVYYFIPERDSAPSDKHNLFGIITSNIPKRTINFLQVILTLIIFIVLVIVIVKGLHDTLSYKYAIPIVVRKKYRR